MSQEYGYMKVERMIVILSLLIQFPYLLSKNGLFRFRFLVDGGKRVMKSLFIFLKLKKGANAPFLIAENLRMIKSIIQ